MALEPLPGELALRQGADEVADRLLTGTEILADEAAFSRRRNEHGIVGDDRVVEIDPDKHFCISSSDFGPPHVERATRTEPPKQFAAPSLARTSPGRRSLSHIDAHWRIGRCPVRD